MCYLSVSVPSKTPILLDDRIIPQDALQTNLHTSVSALALKTTSAFGNSMSPYMVPIRQISHLLEMVLGLSLDPVKSVILGPEFSKISSTASMVGVE